MPTAYRRAARKYDRDFGYGRGLSPAEAAAEQAAGRPGPVEAVLNEYVTEGLVVGSFGEWSNTMHKLCDLCASQIAWARWRDMGADTYAEAKAYMVTATRRRWAAAARRVNGNMRLRRAATIVGDTRGRAADAYGHEAVDGDDAGAAALFAGGIWPDTGGGFGGGCGREHAASPLRRRRTARALALVQP